MTEKRQNITIMVHGGAWWDFMPYWPSTTQVFDFVDWLNGVVEKIPEEYRANAEIEIDSIGGYEGEHHAEVNISYERPETDEEMATRLDNERRQRINSEAREREEYERLKLKFWSH